MIEFSKDLRIPEVEYANQGNAILGIRDSGKSYTATWLAERLLDIGIPFVAFDPIGVWRNLKLPGKKGNGYEVVVAGDDGDLPLTPTSAPEIVRAAMRENIPLVIDLYSIGLSKADWKKIVETCVRILLFENKRYGLRHVFIEEAAEFAPQRVGPDVGRVYAEIEKLARMGGNAGLGYTLINQRAEEVNKAILELCDCLFLHRQKGRHSLVALGKWLDAADAKESRLIVKSLPSLEQGGCWVWSQGRKDPVLIRIPIKRSHHPDRRNLAATAAVAKAGADVSGFVARLMKAVDHEGPRPPKVMRMARLVDAGKDDSTELVKTLRTRIGELEVKCEHLHSENVQLREQLVVAAGHFSDALEALQVPVTTVKRVLPAPALMLVDNSPDQMKMLPPPAVRAVGSHKLPKAMASILAVLKAHHPQPRTRESVALQAGYSVKGGGFLNSLSQARSTGLVEGSKLLRITDLGAKYASNVQPIPTGTALVDYWSQILGRAERLILKVVTTPPRQVFSRQFIALRAGYEATGGGFLNALSRLRTLGIIEGSREIRAAEEFFI